MSSEEIYTLVEKHGNLDDNDRQPLSRKSKTPRWKMLIHEVLEQRVKNGNVRRRNHEGETRR